MNWKTVGPRISAAYDLMGNGQTALKVAAGRYYYVIASGGGILDGVNPNANYSGAVHLERRQRRSPLPARRADRHAGDHARRHRRRSRSIPTTCAPTPTSSPAASTTSCFPALRLSAIYTHRLERNPQATSNPANPFDTFLTTRADTGRDGVAGTADDAHVPVLQPHLDGGEPDLLHQRPQLPPDLQRPRDHGHQAHVEPLADAGRLHLRAEPRRGPERQHQPEHADQRDRPAGRPEHQLQRADRRPAAPVQGDRHLRRCRSTTSAWPATSTRRAASPITRQVTVAQTVGGNSTVNVEPLGSYRLPRRTVGRPARLQERRASARASSRCRWTSTTSPTPTRSGTRAR